MTASNEPSNGYTWFQRFWPIFIVLVSLAATWGAFTTRMTALEQQVDKNEIHLEAVDSTFTDIKVSLMKIQTDLGYIRTELDKHVED